VNEPNLWGLSGGALRGFVCSGWVLGIAMPVSQSYGGIDMGGTLSSWVASWQVPPPQGL
jgi:hypothetical protein